MPIHHSSPHLFNYSTILAPSSPSSRSIVQQNPLQPFEKIPSCRPQYPLSSSNCLLKLYLAYPGGVRKKIGLPACHILDSVRKSSGSPPSCQENDEMKAIFRSQQIDDDEHLDHHRTWTRYMTQQLAWTSNK